MINPNDFGNSGTTAQWAALNLALYPNLTGTDTTVNSRLFVTSDGKLRYEDLRFTGFSALDDFLSEVGSLLIDDQAIRLDATTSDWGSAVILNGYRIEGWDTSVAAYVYMIDDMGNSKLNYVAPAFDTISAMETWLNSVGGNLLYGQVADRLGYYELGDVPPLQFTYDPASTTAENGGTVFDGGLGTGRLIAKPDPSLVSVEMFGARADFPFSHWRQHTKAQIASTTDNTVSFNNCIQYCNENSVKTLYLDKGFYRVTGTIENKLYGVNFVGQGLSLFTSDGSTDQINEWRAGTGIVRDPGVTGGSAVTISDYEPVYIVRGAWDQSEWDLVNGGSGGTWNNGKNRLKECLSANIWFLDIAGGSDYSVPDYDGSTHFSPICATWGTQKHTFRNCQFQARGYAVDVRDAFDDVLEDCRFNCGAGYDANGSSASNRTTYGNSIGAVWIHRTMSGVWGSIGTFDFRGANVMEGNYIMDILAGGTGPYSQSFWKKPVSGSETGDISDLSYMVVPKVGGSGGTSYYRTMRGVFERLQNCNLNCGGYLRNYDSGANLVVAAQYSFTNVDNSSVTVSGGIYVDASHGDDGFSDYQYAAKFDSCENTIVRPGNFSGSNFSLEAASTEFPIYLDPSSISDGCYVIDADLPVLSTWPSGIVRDGTQEHGDFDARRDALLASSLALFDGTANARCSITTSSVAQMGTGDFTAAALVYVSGGSDVRGIFGSGSNSAFCNTAGEYLIINSSNTLVWNANGNSQSILANFTSYFSGYYWLVVQRQGDRLVVRVNLMPIFDDTNANFGGVLLSSTSQHWHLGIGFTDQGFDGQILRHYLLNEFVPAEDLGKLLYKGPSGYQLYGGDETAITSGPTTNGARYQIVDNSGSFDATNAGAPNNDVGTYFTGNGATPTYSTGSIKRVGILYAPVSSWDGGFYDLGNHKFAVTKGSGVSIISGERIAAETAVTSNPATLNDAASKSDVQALIDALVASKLIG